MIKRLFIFILLNFGALAISGLFTPGGINSVWYDTLNKAPWTPPGWMFGFAWFTIMACLSIFMSTLAPNKILLRTYAVQLILNISWSPAFFYFKLTSLGLIIITLLTIIVGYMWWKFKTLYTSKSYLLLPYLAWLVVASSLNLYIVLYN